ncbi:MAG: type II secretion system protein E [Deltaproteobacteria bacterium]|nr:type II secretion system protein E [Deltaproteobacteria bacterium]
MDVTERIQGLISDNVAITALLEAAKADGMLTIRQCAIRKMLEGITTYEEVVGITG